MVQILDNPGTSACGPAGAFGHLYLIAFGQLVLFQADGGLAISIEDRKSSIQTLLLLNSYV